MDGFIFVNFNYNNKEYNNIRVNIPTGECYGYSENQKVNVSFDPSDINNTIILIPGIPLNPKKIIIPVLVFFIVFLVIVIIVDIYLKKSKIGTQIAGGVGLFDLVKNII